MVRKFGIARGYLVFFAALVLILLLISGCNYPFPESNKDDSKETQSIDLTQERGQTRTAQAEKTAQIEEAQQATSLFASAIVQAEMTITASNATATEQAIRDAAATSRVQTTDTPEAPPKLTPTDTEASQPTTPQITYTTIPDTPQSKMIVRNPGDKSTGDHNVTVRNKTGSTVTVVMYGKTFNYTFFIPDGQQIIYLKPGYYTFNYKACGKDFKGSRIFNSNVTWELKCD